MKLFALLSLIVALLACAWIPGTAAQAASPGKSIALLAKSGPHRISAKKNLITFYFRIKGLRWTVKKAGTAPRGDGYVRMYLDKIPKRAYRTEAPYGLFNDSKPYPMGGAKYGVSIGPDSAWIKIHKGRHHLLIGLADNAYVMYSAKPASFALNVRG